MLQRGKKYAVAVSDMQGWRISGCLASGVRGGRIEGATERDGERREGKEGPEHVGVAPAADRRFRASGLSAACVRERSGDGWTAVNRETPGRVPGGNVVACPPMLGPGPDTPPPLSRVTPPRPPSPAADLPIPLSPQAWRTRTRSTSPSRPPTRRAPRPTPPSSPPSRPGRRSPTMPRSTATRAQTASRTRRRSLACLMGMAVGHWRTACGRGVKGSG